MALSQENHIIEKTIKDNRAFFLKNLLKSFLSLLSFVATVIGLLAAFSDLEPLKTFGLPTFVVLLLGIFSVSLLYSVHELFQNLSEKLATVYNQEIKTADGENKLSDELISTIQKLHKNGKHAEVVRFASNISRPLWISGKYKQRVIIGSFFEDSACRNNEIPFQISALIDDLGWTNAVIGNYKEAKKNITSGISIAKDSGYFYLAAKGYRHLGGLELRYFENIPQSITEFENALKICSSIIIQTDKLEMEAGIKYNLSELYLKQGEIEKAFEYAEEASQLFSGLEDYVRLLKINSQKARILFFQKKYGEAKILFTKTLEQSKLLGRPDETGKCLLGLGELYIKENKKSLAQNVLSEAMDIFKEIGSIKDISKANELMSRLSLNESI